MLTTTMAAMDRCKLFAWLLVVVFLVCSCAAPAVRSSRLLAAEGNARDEAFAAGASRGQREEEEVRSRRSLGFRSPWSPPAPLWNRPTTMPVPPPPWA